MAIGQLPGYIVIRKVAEGGFSEIFEAHQIASHRRVAIKILHPVHAGNEVEQRRILKEAALTQVLPPHPNLVHIIEHGQSGTRPYIVMEFIAGRSLRQILHENRVLSERDILRLGAALAEALQHLHTAGIVHKDVKPDNVMVEGTRGIVLLDLGLAEAVGSTRWRFFGRKLEGSPAYLAPELIRSKRASPASDVYALGCTLYEAATGHAPFAGANAHQVLAKQVDLSLRPDPILMANPRISVATQRLIFQALEKDARLRLQSMQEFLLALARHPMYEDAVARWMARGQPEDAFASSAARSRLTRK